MVDEIQETLGRDEGFSNTSPAYNSAINHTIEISQSHDAIEQYCNLTEAFLFSPSQSPIWVKNWFKHCNDDMICLFIYNEEKQLCLALALEVIVKKGLKLAAYPGHSHANGNFAAANTTAALPSPQHIVELVTTALNRHRPDIDALCLERQEPQILSHQNPLILANSLTSPNFALVTELENGFDGFLKQKNGKRIRKKHRNNARKFQEIGDIEYSSAKTESEVRLFLDQVFQMKRQRFGELGIRDVFADREIQAFFHALYSDGLECNPPQFSLHSIKVNNQIIAASADSFCADRMICEFSGFIPDHKNNTSPGDFLFYENIEWAAEKGYMFHDFSVGDALFKRLWTTKETTQYDTIVGLNLKGKIARTALIFAGSLKRKIKQSPTIWNFLKKTRKLLAR